MVVTKRVSLQTKGNCDIIDITPEVQEQLAEADMSDGTVTLFVSGSTAGISTIEFESGLLSDFKGMWERNIPRDIPYKHDRTWGEGNGYSHVRASLLGASLVIPFSDKKLGVPGRGRISICPGSDYLTSWLSGLLQLLERYPEGRLIAGAAELGLDITKRWRFPTLVVEAVPELTEIRCTEAEWRIGAAVTLTQIRSRWQASSRRWPTC